jgi:hypothetical protein
VYNFLVVQKNGKCLISFLFQVILNEEIIDCSESLEKDALDRYFEAIFELLEDFILADEFLSYKTGRWQPRELCGEATTTSHRIFFVYDQFTQIGSSISL